VSGTPFSDRKWPRAEIKFPEVGTLAIRLHQLSFNIISTPICISSSIPLQYASMQIWISTSCRICVQLQSPFISVDDQQLDAVWGFCLMHLKSEVQPIYTYND